MNRKGNDMKNENGKRLLITAAILLTLGTLIGCSSQPRQASLREEKAALQWDWEACLEISESRFRQLLWVYDSVEVYVRDNSWESLLKARAACAAAMRSLQQLSPREQAVSQEQYQALIGAGIEADVVAMEWENLSAGITQTIQTLTMLETILQDDIYFTESVEILADRVTVGRQIVQDECSYLCLTTNYLLLQMQADGLWEELEGRYPTIAACRDPWYSDPEPIMSKCGAVLEDLQAQQTRLSEFLGVSDYTLKLVEEAAATGDVSRLAKQMNRIVGIPAYFPLPGWVAENPAQCRYLITDTQTRELRLADPLEALSQAPSACHLLCGGIDREAVEGYGQRLKSWGLEPYADWDEEAETYRLWVTSGESQLLVEWTRDETTLCLTSPVACLIPELYLLAMLPAYSQD